MAYADWDFYKNTYKGIIITSDGDYAYFAERAGDTLALYECKIPKTNEGQLALKKCACAIADILYGDYKSSKNGTQKQSSESVSGYYSVSYSTPTASELNALIYAKIRLYLGKWLCVSTRFVRW